MRTSKTGLVAALVLGGLLACGSAIAQDANAKQDGKQGGRRGGPSLEQLSERLNLTDEQKPKVKAVLEETSKKRAELSGVAQEERREKARAIMEDQTKKMKEILTPEQFTKYQEMRPTRPGAGAGAGGASGDAAAKPKASPNPQ
jgi:protein CpxP